MNGELISIIIPTYKRYDLLERAIKSVLNQTYKNLEIIVVDDNISDSMERKKTEEIMKKYPDIIYIKNKKNLGGGLTRNVGIKRATGNYIAFLDDDDEFLPSKIEEQYKLYKKLNSDRVGMIYCYKDDYDVFGQYKITYKRDYEGLQLYNHMLHFIATTSCWFCPKVVLENVGMFDDISSQQDATLLTKILGADYEIYRVPKSLVKFYLHNKNNGITTVSEKYINDIRKYREVCRSYYSKLTKKQIINVEYKFKNQICNLYIQNKNKKNAKKEVFDMINLKPFAVANIKNIVKILIYI